MGEKEELEVEIIERRETPFPTVEGEERVEVWITYRYGRLPPGLVRIPKEKATPEEIKLRIRSDIQKRLAARPEKLKV